MTRSEQDTADYPEQDVDLHKETHGIPESALKKILKKTFGDGIAPTIVDKVCSSANKRHDTGCLSIPHAQLYLLNNTPQKTISLELQYQYLAAIYDL